MKIPFPFFLKVRRSSLAMLSVVALAASLWIAPPAMASSSALDAFNSLVNNAQTTGPGYYTSATRNIFVGGSMHVWVPRQKVNLLSLSPPAIHAGCGGISAYFGGMSFISGDQIKQIAKHIMSGAVVGYIVQLGIRVLCPMCADILSQLQALAQKAAALSSNTCRMAQGLVNSALKLGGVSGSGILGMGKDCSAMATDTGQSDSFFAALNDVCQGSEKAMGFLDTTLTNINKTAPASVSTNKNIANIPQFGNHLWEVMTAAGYSNTYVKEVVLSMLGFTVRAKQPASGSGSGTSSPSTQYPSDTKAGWTSGDQADQAAQGLLDILLYGTQPSATLSAIHPLLGSSTAAQTAIGQQIKAAEKLNYGNWPFYICYGGETGATDRAPENTPLQADGGPPPSGIKNLHYCDYPKEYPVKDIASVPGANPLITQTGLIASVWNTLTDAVNNVSQGKPVQDEAIQLMQVIPLPLYRVVNVAAVYPATAQQLVTTYSTVVATLIAQKVVSNWIAFSNAKQTNDVNITPQVTAAIRQMAKVLNTVNTAVKGQVKVIGQALALQDGLLEQLHQINDVMYQSLAGSGIQGNLLFSQGAAAGLAQGH